MVPDRRAEGPPVVARVRGRAGGVGAMGGGKGRTGARVGEEG